MDPARSAAPASDIDVLFQRIDMLVAILLRLILRQNAESMYRCPMDEAVDSELLIMMQR